MYNATGHFLPLLAFITLLAAAFFLPTSGETLHMDVIQQPIVKSAIEGTTVTLNCEATILEGLEYTWVHNGHTLQNTSRVYKQGPILTINQLNRSLDHGDYKCIAKSEDSGAQEVSPVTTIKVIWIENASILRHQPLLGKYKNYIIFKCNVDGSYPMIIEWYKNSAKLNENSHIYVDELERKLIIFKPSHNDIGVYQCSAKNNAGIVFSQQSYEFKLNDHTLINLEEAKEVRCSLHKQKRKSMQNLKNGLKQYSIDSQKLIRKYNENKEPYLCRGKRGEKMQEFNINELPSIQSSNLVKPKSTVIKLNENEGVTLDCDTGKDTSKKNQILVKWKKDDKLYRQVDIDSPSISPTPDSALNTTLLKEDSRIMANRKNGSLVFSSVISSDSGIYECITFDEHDTPVNLQKYELKIIEQLKFVPPPTSKNLELGTIGKIHCKVQGTPIPQVKWHKIGQSVLADSIEDINGTLIFKNVTADDKGNYTCIASNPQGTINTTIFINTVIAPRFIVAPEGIIQAQEMGSAMVHCQATGDPKPTVQWDKDLQYISNKNSSDSSRVHILENGTLHILEVHLEDEGRYGCTIGSSAGLKREEAQIKVKLADDFTNDESNDDFMITRAVLITMSVAFAYIILVVGLMLWCRYRRQVRKARLNLNDKDTNVENGNGDIKMGEIEPCLPSEKNCKTATKKMNGSTKGDVSQKSDDTAASTNSKVSKKSSSHFDQITLSRNCLFEIVQIGRGDFGDVFIGKIKTGDLKMSDIEPMPLTKGFSDNDKRKSRSSLNEIHEIKEESSDNNDEYKHVLIKALNRSKDENSCLEFRRQIEMFRAISHRSVAKLYGLCRDKDPHYLVLEYTDWGDLKQFLIATNSNTCNGENGKSTASLTTSQILAIAHQIARGMDSIYRARYIHKDLATRNCLITSNFVVKISYPSLNRDKYSKEYYKHKNVLIPLRWLAPECIQDDDYSTKSDVYAFGVVVWELFKRATKLPFDKLSNEEFLSSIKENKLNWQLAEDTPSTISNLMMSCWSSNVKERPTFGQLYSAFGKCLKNEKSTDLKE